jgi:hypothetical protein
MSKKHFIALANALLAAKPADHWDTNKHVQWDLDTRYIANALAQFNPQFDRDRFISACKGEK